MPSPRLIANYVNRGEHQRTTDYLGGLCANTHITAPGFWWLLLSNERLYSLVFDYRLRNE